MPRASTMLEHLPLPGFEGSGMQKQGVQATETRLRGDAWCREGRQGNASNRSQGDPRLVRHDVGGLTLAWKTGVLPTRGRPAQGTDIDASVSGRHHPAMPDRTTMLRIPHAQHSCIQTWMRIQIWMQGRHVFTTWGPTEKLPVSLECEQPQKFSGTMPTCPASSCTPEGGSCRDAGMLLCTVWTVWRPTHPGVSTCSRQRTGCCRR